MRKQTSAKPSKEKIAEHFREIMLELGLNAVTDPSLKGTPDRVAKMYVDELFAGLDPDNYPDITTFPNDKKYDQMLVERNAIIYSNCEHHFVPIVGKVHMAYIPGDVLLGLSKFMRIANYYARRPQVQERLTQEIAEALKKILKTESVAVIIEADHYCCRMRGVLDASSSTVTTHLGGRFMMPEVRKELFDTIKL